MIITKPGYTYVCILSDVSVAESLRGTFAYDYRRSLDWSLLWVPENRLHETLRKKNDNNTNAKQDQKYNTSQTVDDNKYRYTQKGPWTFFSDRAITGDRMETGLTDSCGSCTLVCENCSAKTELQSCRRLGELSVYGRLELECQFLCGWDLE